MEKKLVDMFGNQIFTVLCITIISGMTIYFEADYAKDITIASVAGLVGFLSGSNK